MLAGNERYRAFVELSPDAAHVVDNTGIIVLANRNSAELHGFSGPEEMIGTNALELLVPEDRVRIVETFQRRGADIAQTRENECTALCRDGTCVPVEISTTVATDETGRRAGFIVVLRDVSERRRAEEALRASEARFRTIFEHSPVGIEIADMEGRLVASNRAAQQMLGYSADELDGMHWTKITHPDDIAREDELDEKLVAGEIDFYRIESRQIRKDGRTIWTRQTVSEVFAGPGDPQFAIAMVEDITEQKRVEEALAHQALHDPLTDLPNRVLLRDRVQSAIEAARREGAQVALFFLDLNRFKEVNDSLGHQAGDTLLQLLAARLTGTVRHSDTIARLGGDEFAILLPRTGHDGAVRAAEKVTAALEEPFELDGNLFHLGASIGIALFPDHGDDVQELMSRADVAMYVAKRTDVDHVVYVPEHDVDSPARMALLRDLRTAIDGDRLLLHYQPQLELSSGCPEHVEALVRWQQADGQLIPPDTFIGIAEETGLIRPLTVWVLRAATRQCAGWAERGMDIRVAVNLSARTLHDPQLVETVASALQESRVKPSGLALEITESAIIVDPEGALETLTRLHEMGIQIAIDDFGTGYTSLAHLRRLPVDEIKIDRSFVMDMKHNVDNSFIVRSIIDLGRNLGLRVVAEGVEDRETLDMLAAMGCNMAQGFYLSRPLPAEGFQYWLDAQQHVHGSGSRAAG